MTKIPTPIVDKNGKKTTVHRNEKSSGVANDRVSNIGKSTKKKSIQEARDEARAADQAIEREVRVSEANARLANTIEDVLRDRVKRADKTGNTSLKSTLEDILNDAEERRARPKN